MYQDDAVTDESSKCFFSACNAAASIEAIGTYNALFGLDETIAMMLCDRHAEVVQDVVVLVSVD